MNADEVPDEGYEDFLEGELGPHRDEPWGIHDDSTAMWALRKIAAADALVSSREATQAAEQDRLRRWVDQARRSALQTRAFLEGALRGYAERLRDAGKFGKKKSWPLPNGVLQFRDVGVDFEMQDEAAFTAWAEAHCLTEMVIKVMWGLAKKSFVAAGEGVGARVVVEHINQETGEVTAIPVPGVVVSRIPGERFAVKVDAEEV